MHRGSVSSLQIYITYIHREDNIKKELKERKCEDLDWVHVSQDRNRGLLF
jgi:hypothetical protein